MLLKYNTSQKTEEEGLKAEDRNPILQHQLKVSMLRLSLMTTPVNWRMFSVFLLNCKSQAYIKFM